MLQRIPAINYHMHDLRPEDTGGFITFLDASGKAWYPNIEFSIDPVTHFYWSSISFFKPAIERTQTSGPLWLQPREHSWKEIIDVEHICMGLSNARMYHCAKPWLSQNLLNDLRELLRLCNVRTVSRL